MKKTLMSLAALMMLMAAPVMTSCSNDLDEVTPAAEQGNVVTLTIAPPTQEPETRVAMNDQLKINGWEVGDKVNLYPVPLGDGVGVEFTCTNANAGTFSGVLPEGKTLNDYKIATYGAIFLNVELLAPTTRSSDKLKDVVMMAAVKDNDAYKMKVINNVLKVTNTGNEVVVAWTGKSFDGTTIDFFEPILYLHYEEYQGIILNYALNALETPYKGWDNVTKYTLAGNNAVTYINMTQADENESWGLAKQDGTVVLAKKVMTGKGTYVDAGGIQVVTGKLWSVTVNGN